MARLRYSVSFYAVIDFLAVFPYYLARLSPEVDQYDNYLRLLRLLRILKVRPASERGCKPFGVFLIIIVIIIVITIVVVVIVLLLLFKKGRHRPST